MLGQHDKGEIRPGRLSADPFRETARIDATEGFLGYDGELATRLYSRKEVLKRLANLRSQMRLAQNALRERGVSSARCQDQGPLNRFPMICLGHELSISGALLPT